MGHSLRQRFERRAVLFVVGGALCASFAAAAEPQNQIDENLDISRLVPTGKVCVARSSFTAPQTPVERYFAGQYAAQKTTQVGQMLLGLNEDLVSEVCFDHGLEQDLGCGIKLVGTTLDSGIALNPASRISDKERELTLIHETRHLQQGYFKVDFDGQGNMPEAERVAMYWLIEADARMAEIVYAYEKGLDGDHTYTETLYKDGGYELMLKAFYDSLAKHPDRMQSALEAGMRAFLKMKVMTLSYANQTVDWIEQEGAQFHPDEPAVPVFVASDLDNAGEMAGFGNTMTPTVVSAFQKAFTPQDYARLTKARDRNNGAHTCTP